ncbi:hypothetical protein TI05_10770 [Achromatium sp. WMS3]|nr:hypothetical protein TI05_10770 [Achromatium sp. WMS3]
MVKTHYNQLALRAKPPSPWLKNSANKIDYWLHVPTKECGISLRGLSRLCGVHISTLQNAIRNAQKNSQKVGEEVTYLRESELNKLLKGKTFFLEEVTYLSPMQQGGPVKVILLEVCMIFIRYYAMKGKIEAIKTLALFSDFGAEQFIFIQVGFIPRPESIMLDDIEYLIAKETVQVNKSRQEEVQFFTNPLTGECGIELQGLSYICGGVALQHVKTFLNSQTDPYVQANHPEQIVKASVCTLVLEHFGNHHKPRKTLAQQWDKTLKHIVPVLHQKTNYQAPAVTDRETQLVQQVDDLKDEVARLKQLLKEEEAKGNKKRHRMMGRVLQWKIPPSCYEVHLEEDTSHVAQLLDGLILKRNPQQQLPANIELPDGLTLDAEINMLTYKSPCESLNQWTIQELIGHYVGYRKMLKAQHPNHTWKDANQFALYAVTTMFPQELVKQVGTAWQLTDKSGVYKLLSLGLEITVIV